MMKTNAPSRNFLRSKAYVVRVGIFIAIASLAIFSLLTASSASRGGSSANAKGALPSNNSTSEVGSKVGNPSLLSLPLVNKLALPFAFMPQAAVETVAIYEADCTTPQTNFVLSQITTQTVCAKLTGAPLGSRPTQVQRRLSIVGPGGYIRSESDVSALSSTATLLFDIPATATSLVGGDTVDNRGSWQAISVSGRDGSVRAEAGFQVTDSNPAVKIADLSLQSAVDASGELAPNENVTFILYLANSGPNAAQGVAITDDVPANTTFFSATSSDPNFTCSGVALGGVGTTTCSATSMARGDKVKFAMTYKVDSGTPLKTLITNIAEVATTTPQRSTRDDITKATAAVTDVETVDTCQLGCPADVIVTVPANSSGTNVKFGAASGNGDCGAITNSPGSGTFFAVGTHTITSTSEAGPTCTFKVKVLDTPAPTISCPTNKVATAGEDGTATVNPGAPPSFTPANGTVVGVRTDARPAVYDEDGVVVTPGYNPSLTLDPYPTGITGITWTVTDGDGRTASCKQTVTVNKICADDTERPTFTCEDCVVPSNITVTTGPDNTGCTVSLDDELGQAIAHDNCSVTITVSGIPAGNEFPIGTTTLTYTATDAAGNTNLVPATQTVTVIDDTAPRIVAPPNATYTCVSQVPEANANQATRGEVRDEDGNLLPPGAPFDNCGNPTVGVTESSTGIGSASSPLIITRTFTATDSAATPNSASAVQTITVIDSVAPTIADPADVTANTGLGAVSCDTTVTLTAPAASDNCAGVTVTRSPSGNTFPVGTTEVIWTATDAVGNTATASQNVIVNDNTVPTIIAPAAKTLYTGSGATSCSVTVADLDVTLGTPTVADNCDGVTWVRDGGNVFSLGNTTVTYTATDAKGNVNTATQVVTVVDNTPPVVTPPANITVYLPLNSTATSMPVTYPNPATATDNCGGTITFSYSPASGSTFSVGTGTVTVTATDAHNNSAQATFTVTVLYNFTGFFSPVGNLPVLNSVNAGRAIPLKFSLSGDKGLGIFPVGSPVSGQIPCDTSAPLTDLEGTVTSGGSTLTYSPDQYHYNWKTESSWAGTCRQLVVTLNDGSQHVTRFKFK